MKKEKIDIELSVKAFETGNPETVEEIINCYGTYNIQPTSNTKNMYPTISQGYNKKQIKTDCKNKMPPRIH